MRFFLFVLFVLLQHSEVHAKEKVVVIAYPPSYSALNHFSCLKLLIRAATLSPVSPISQLAPDHLPMEPIFSFADPANMTSRLPADHCLLQLSLWACEGLKPFSLRVFSGLHISKQVLQGS